MEESARLPLTPRPMPPLRGDEAIVGVPDATVVDFWRFAMPDLRMNNTRGLFAEFLVHQAVGSTKPRVEWASHDVETDDGLRIEVKAGAYLQAWEQRAPSQVRFTGLRARTWSPDRGYSEAKSYNADVYVFAVQTAREHAVFNPLDTAQWEFYVLPHPVVASLGTDSASLKSGSHGGRSASSLSRPRRLHPVGRSPPRRDRRLTRRAAGRLQDTTPTLL